MTYIRIYGIVYSVKRNYRTKEDKMHYITYMDFDKNATKGEIYAERAMLIEEEGERDCGVLLSDDSGFTFHDHVAESYEDAVEYIKSKDNGWYDDHGCYYKEYEKTKTAKAAESRIQKMREEKKKYICEHSIKNHKSKFIGCKKCGSKIATAFLGNSEKCPVCHTDLRSDYILERIKKYDSDIKKAEKKTVSKKYTIRKLVKLEFHC